MLQSKSKKNRYHSLSRIRSYSNNSEVIAILKHKITPNTNNTNKATKAKTQILL